MGFSFAKGFYIGLYDYSSWFYDLAGLRPSNPPHKGDYVPF